jgi:hypothetical protein
MSDVTGILKAIEQGDPKAADELLPLVYGELRKLAASRMACNSTKPQTGRTRPLAGKSDWTTFVRRKSAARRGVQMKSTDHGHAAQP